MKDYSVTFEAQNYSSIGNPIGNPIELPDLETFTAENHAKALKKACKITREKESLHSLTNGRLKGTRKFRIRIKAIVCEGPPKEEIFIRKPKEKKLILPHGFLNKNDLSGIDVPQQYDTKNAFGC